MRRTIPGVLAALSAAACATPLVHDGVLVPQRYQAVLQETGSAWGEPLDPPVPARLIRSDDVGPLLRELIAEDWQPQELADYVDALVAVGLWPADRDLIAEHVAVSREEVAGFYAPTRRTLFVVGDLRVPLGVRLESALMRRDVFWEAILAHELVHALQHQSYPQLVETLRWRGQDDAVNAVTAAIEGDATRYGFEALGLPLLPAPEQMRRKVENGAAGAALARAPALLRLTLTFPYVEGYRLAYAEGHGLLDTPPASTEQALHPERRREPFLAIDLAPLYGALPRSCRILAENGMGELGISVLLRDLGGADVSPEAWEGWNGDRFLAARCDGSRAFVWITAWDSEADAAEFETAYRAVAGAVAARAGLTAPPQVERRGREVHVWTASLASLADLLVRTPRRAEVASLDGLREHFAEATRMAARREAPGAAQPASAGRSGSNSSSAAGPSPSARSSSGPRPSKRSSVPASTTR
jgi:hypothetical protein